MLYLFLFCFLNIYANVSIKLPKSVSKSFQVYDIKKDKIINSYMPYKIMDGASTVKIFTAAAFIDYFGMQYKYKTSLLSNASVKNKALYGNIYLDFTGDPSLTVDKLSELFSNFENVKKINGNIIIYNNSNKSHYGPGWMLDDMQHCYATPVTNINLNNNCVTLIADKISKNKYQINTSILHGVRIVNKLFWRKSCKKSAKIQQNGKGYVWRGCLSVKHFADVVAVKDMRHWVKSGVKTALKKAGIKLNGSIKFNNKKLNAKKYKISFSIYSDSLDKMLKKVLKHSDNLVSSSLFLSFSNDFSWKQSRVSLHKFLYDDSIHKVNLVDGSGLSRLNKISSNNLLFILKKIYKNKNLYENIVPNLAVLGEDGTLEHSKINLPDGVKVVGKTGSMFGVDAICGYVLKNNVPKFIYVLMLNSLGSDKKIMRSYRDAWLENLVKL